MARLHVLPAAQSPLLPHVSLQAWVVPSQPKGEHGIRNAKTQVPAALGYDTVSTELLQLRAQGAELNPCQVAVPAASDVSTLPAPAPVGIFRPVVFVVPATSRVAAGALVLMPTLPNALIRNWLLALDVIAGQSAQTQTKEPRVLACAPKPAAYE